MKAEIGIQKTHDQMLFSNILQTKVHLCCHQSARLKDKYCVCDRALEYPPEVKKQ